MLKKFMMMIFVLSLMCEFNFSLASDEANDNLSRYMSKSLSKFEKSFEERDFTTSKEILNKLEAKSDEFSKYERAKLWEAYGNLYYVADKNETIKYFKMALSEQSDVARFECSIRLSLARLNYLAKNYSDSVASFHTLKENSCFLDAKDIALSAFSLTAEGNFLKAKQELNTAYITAEKEKVTPPKSWGILLEDINEALVIGYSTIFLPSPKYPRRALSRGVEGDVTVRFTFDVDGQAYDPAILKSTSELFNRSVLTFLNSDELKPLVKHWNITERTELERTFEFRMAKGQRVTIKSE